MSVSGFILAVLAVSLWPGESRLVTDPLSPPKDKSVDLDTCLECSQIVQLSANIIPSRDTKETVYEALHALCQHLPKHQASECDSQIIMYLPKVLQQASGHLNPEETCMAFGLCAANKEEKPLELPHQATSRAVSSLAPGTEDNQAVNFPIICPLCKKLVKTLESLLPINATEDYVLKLVGKLCSHLPGKAGDLCQAGLDKYGKKIVHLLLTQGAPEAICVLLEACFFEEQTLPDMSLPLECESCRTLAVLSQPYLGPNPTKTETSSFLQSVCVHHPNAIPKCEAFIKIFGDRLQEAFGDQTDGTHACERADLCASHTLEPLRKNPCSLGPSYWCKDIHTAQKCGNQAFCKKYVWKN